MLSGSMANLRAALDSGECSAWDLVQGAWARMDRLEGTLHATVRRVPGLTRKAAELADARLSQGERSPLLGIPFVLKDNLHWKGAPVGNGSRILEGYVAPYSATVIRRLLDAGAVPLAMANMDEFAMGSSGEFSAFGSTRNPWDPDRVPGGSSSGSIVSVAAGYAPLALGSDTGGSVRLPASFCGVTALRPTYGVLSRYGLTAMASSLDQVGPVARSAQDLAQGLAALIGRDSLDSTSVDLRDAGRLGNLRPGSLRGLRIGLPKECFGPGLDAGVRAALDGALAVLSAEGAELVDVVLPHTGFAIDTYYLLVTSEVSSNLSRFDGVRYGARRDGEGIGGMIAETRDQGFGAEVKRRILLGTFCLSRGFYEAFYLRALKARTLIRRDFEEAFRLADVLALPASPTVAFRFGERTSDPLSMYLTDAYTVPAALASLPALALPAGFSEGLPVGMQLLGPAFSDVKLLEIGHAFQSLTDHHLKIPPLALC